VARGVYFLDTAPAYGPSETILGEFLHEGGRDQPHLIIATKMGEHWIEELRTHVPTIVSKRCAPVSIKVCSARTHRSDAGA
jgi:aryl-alcohol dehydrogenase-like predicted oxidoreductase